MCNNSNFVLNEDNGGDIAAKELADAWEHDADIIDEKNENTLLQKNLWKGKIRKYIVVPKD